MSVWKKSDSDQSFEPASAPAAASNTARPPVRRTIATIGPSITIQGDVTGEEDLLVEGRVQGTVQLRNHAVTVGESGKLKAQIVAKSITIRGTVEGDLLGEEDVTVHPTGSVLGNIRAPRVSLESGCRFKGSIDMEKAVKLAGDKPPQQRTAEPPTVEKADSASPAQASLNPSLSGPSSSSS